MWWSHAGYVLAAMVLLAAPDARAQGQFLSDPQVQQMMQKFFNPVVGAGEEYQRTGGSGGDHHGLQLALLGTEAVQGGTGYWVEMTFNFPELDGTTYAKDLIVPGEERPRRVILQLPGEAPMEWPSPGKPGKTKVENRHLHQVGTESVTVPAGTFVCEHWQDDNSDVWISSKLAPVTLVKSVDRHDHETDELVKTFRGAKDHITGAIKPFDPSVFMRHMKQPGGDD
jgi:hypothetical protein